jgi:hypothetical protein
VALNERVLVIESEAARGSGVACVGDWCVDSKLRGATQRDLRADVVDEVLISSDVRSNAREGKPSYTGGRVENGSLNSTEWSNKKNKTENSEETADPETDVSIDWRMTSPCEPSNSAADEDDKANEPSLLANPKVADVGFECSQRHVELEVSSERSITGNNDMIIEQLNQAIPEKSFLSIRVNGPHFQAGVLGRLTRHIRKFAFNCEHFFVYFWKGDEAGTTVRRQKPPVYGEHVFVLALFCHVERSRDISDHSQEENS